MTKKPEVPQSLLTVIEDAMEKYGPDGHIDGSDKIALAVLDWIKKHKENDND